MFIVMRKPNMLFRGLNVLIAFIKPTKLMWNFLFGKDHEGIIMNTSNTSLCCTIIAHLLKIFKNGVCGQLSQNIHPICKIGKDMSSNILIAYIDGLIGTRYTIKTTTLKVEGCSFQCSFLACMHAGEILFTQALLWDNCAYKWHLNCYKWNQY